MNEKDKGGERGRGREEKRIGLMGKCTNRGKSADVDSTKACQNRHSRCEKKEKKGCLVD